MISTGSCYTLQCLPRELDHKGFDKTIWLKIYNVWCVCQIGDVCRSFNTNFNFHKNVIEQFMKHMYLLSMLCATVIPWNLRHWFLLIGIFQICASKHSFVDVCHFPLKNQISRFWNSCNFHCTDQPRSLRTLCTFPEDANSWT